MFPDIKQEKNGPVPDLNTALPLTDRTRRPRGKPFEPGNRQGKGRPRGSRNKQTLLFQGAIDEYGPMIIRKTLKMAMEGDRTAIKLTMERLVPPAQHDRIDLHLPPVRCSADLTKVSAAVIRAAGRGELTIEQAKGVGEMLQIHGRLIEKQDFEHRIVALEQRASVPANDLGIQSVEQQNPSAAGKIPDAQ